MSPELGSRWSWSEIRFLKRYQIRSFIHRFSIQNIPYPNWSKLSSWLSRIRYWWHSCKIRSDLTGFCWWSAWSWPPSRRRWWPPWCCRRRLIPPTISCGYYYTTPSVVEKTNYSQTRLKWPISSLPGLQGQKKFSGCNNKLFNAYKIY